MSDCDLQRIYYLLNKYYNRVHNIMNAIYNKKVVNFSTNIVNLFKSNFSSKFSSSNNSKIW